METKSYLGPTQPLYNYRSLIQLPYYQCFFYPPRESKGNIHFCNNTSVKGGHSLYGGSIDRCYFRKSTAESVKHKTSISKKSVSLFFNMILFCRSVFSQISSLPRYLCFCEKSNYTCSQLEQKTSVVPGQTISISIVAVGQLEGTTLATVQARLMISNEERSDSHHPYILQSQARQLLELPCNNIQYTVHAPVGTETLVLTVKELADEDVNTRVSEFRDFGYRREKIQFTGEVPLLVNITLRPCSLGYKHNTKTLSCECHPYLSNIEIDCILNNQTIINFDQVQFG